MAYCKRFDNIWLWSYSINNMDIALNLGKLDLLFKGACESIERKMNRSVSLSSFIWPLYTISQLCTGPSNSNVHLYYCRLFWAFEYGRPNRGAESVKLTKINRMQYILSNAANLSHICWISQAGPSMASETSNTRRIGLLDAQTNRVICSRQHTD